MRPMIWVQARVLSPTLTLALNLALTLALITLSGRAFATEGTEQDRAASFEFALIGDPQIGYGRGAELGGSRRFAQVVDGVNAAGVALSVIPGDLVQDRTLWQWWAFRKNVGQLSARVLLAVGNHDVVDEASLAAYRAAHGPDYYDTVHGNAAFVVLNSETARDWSISPVEYEAQWRFIETTLARHGAEQRDPIFLVMHRPPFVDDEAEPESGANWPSASRGKLLSLARTHGARWILAGHLHRTHRVETSDGLRIVVVAGSARSFDQSPIGFERFRVSPEGVTSEWVTLAPAPAEPFHVPGFREWTPRLFDFSLRHWVLTLLYAGVGLLALRAGRRERTSSAPLRARLWFVVAGVLFAFAANTQLDFDEFLREFGRLAARVAGVYALRHVITGAALATGVLYGTFQLARLYLRARADRALTISLGMLLVPVGWFALSTISHHDLEMLFREDWWDLASVVALATIAWCAKADHRVSAVRRTSTR